MALTGALAITVHTVTGFSNRSLRSLDDQPGASSPDICSSDASRIRRDGSSDRPYPRPSQQRWRSDQWDCLHVRGVVVAVRLLVPADRADTRYCRRAGSPRPPVEDVDVAALIGQEVNLPRPEGRSSQSERRQVVRVSSADQLRKGHAEHPTDDRSFTQCDLALAGLNLDPGYDRDLGGS
jgi:hypothetical protein